MTKFRTAALIKVTLPLAFLFSSLASLEVLARSSEGDGSGQSQQPAALAPGQAQTPPTEVTVDPEFLRKQVLENNLSLEQELNTVKDQKDKVNVARGQLLPSLNLGLLISGGPSFLISSIQFLVPFLFPSSWVALDAAQDQFNAEVISYKILELNVYSSSLAIYYTILSDLKISEIYEQQAADLLHIYQVKKHESDLLGTISPQDLAQTLANAQLAQVSASQLKEMALQELAAIRQVMGLPLSTTIKFNMYDQMPVSEFETRPVADGVAQALLVSPENNQIDYLIKAAQAKKLGAEFGFLNSASLGATGSNGNNANLGNSTGSLSFHFGFDYFPNLSLSERAIDEAKLLKSQLILQLTQTLEAVVSSVKLAKDQLTDATLAENELNNVYLTTVQKYKMGIASLLDVLTTHAQLTQASIARIKSEQDLNQQRVSLHRVMLSSGFAQIKGCTLQPQKKSGFLGGIFDKTVKESLDHLCREGGSRQPAN